MLAFSANLNIEEVSIFLDVQCLVVNLLTEDIFYCCHST